MKTLKIIAITMAIGLMRPGLAQDRRCKVELAELLQQWDEPQGMDGDSWHYLEYKVISTPNDSLVRRSSEALIRLYQGREVMVMDGEHFKVIRDEEESLLVLYGQKLIYRSDAGPSREPISRKMRDNLISTGEVMNCRLLSNGEKEVIIKTSGQQAQLAKILQLKVQFRPESQQLTEVQLFYGPGHPLSSVLMQFKTSEVLKGEDVNIPSTAISAVLDSKGTLHQDYKDFKLIDDRLKSQSP